MSIPNWLSKPDFAPIVQLALDALRDLGSEESQGIMLERGESGHVRAYFYQATQCPSDPALLTEVEPSNKTQMITELVFNALAFQALTLRELSAQVYQSAESVENQATTGSANLLRNFIDNLSENEGIHFELGPDERHWKMWISHTL